jgi:hypothetical protein
MASQSEPIKDVGDEDSILRTLETRIRMVRTLKDDYSHVILSAEGVKKYSEAFGCKLSTETIPPHLLNDPTSPVNQGLASDDLAVDLCGRFRVKYKTKIGRGSRLRECCEKLLLFFQQQERDEKEARSSKPEVLGEARSSKQEVKEDN